MCSVNRDDRESTIENEQTTGANKWVTFSEVLIALAKVDRRQREAEANDAQQVVTEAAEPDKT